MKTERIHPSTNLPNNLPEGSMNCGEATMRLLAKYGVDTVFGTPGVHTLDFCRGLKEGPVESEAFERLISPLGLDKKIDQRIDTLSHGYRKRVSIARALLHKPAVLLLDEPESGLDIQTVKIFEDIIADFIRSGGAALVTTHSREAAYGEKVTYYNLEQGKLF